MKRLAFWIGVLLSIGAIAEMAASETDTKIPLPKIVTTSPQSDLQAFEVAFPKEDERRKLFQQISVFSSGASNLFLVDATNALDAVKASLSVLEGSHSADAPATVNTADPERGSNWLVAYLGVGPSEPVWWVVESVTLNGNSIRVSYHHPEANLVTRDVWRFYYWVPLGKLSPGNYQLELFDAKNKVVMLSRRVTIQTDKGE